MERLGSNGLFQDEGDTPGRWPTERAVQDEAGNSVAAPRSSRPTLSEHLRIEIEQPQALADAIGVGNAPPGLCRVTGLPTARLVSVHLRDIQRPAANGRSVAHRTGVYPGGQRHGLAVISKAADTRPARVSGREADWPPDKRARCNTELEPTDFAAHP